MANNYDKALKFTGMIAKLEPGCAPSVGYMQQLIYRARVAWEEFESDPSKWLETDTDYFEELTILQRSYGYEKGDVNPVALLGLFGEAGEVLAEVCFTGENLNTVNLEFLREAATKMGVMMDDQKKIIRSRHWDAPDTAIVKDDNGEALDIEIADTLYYLNLIALNRGKTLAEYAAMSVAKVKTKSLQNPAKQQNK